MDVKDVKESKKKMQIKSNPNGHLILSHTRHEDEQQVFAYSS